MKLTGIRKIIFITLSNIGDVVLTLPVLTGLRHNFPDAMIDVVAGPRPRDIFKKDPRIRKIFVYNKQAGLKEKIDFIRELHREKYDLAVDMRTSLMPFLIGARKRSPLVKRHKTGEKHKGVVHLNKLKELGLARGAGPGIYIDDDDRGKMEELLERHGCGKENTLIGISPSTRGILKQWDTGCFIEVIQDLLRKGDYRIVLIGDDSQVDISRKIRGSVKHDSVIDLTGAINLSGLFALIGRMQVLLTGDSAALHAASDLGIKTIALFGPTDPLEYGPRGKDDIVIRKELRCSPCKKAACAFNHECMGEIRPAEVIAALNRLLNGY